MPKRRVLLFSIGTFAPTSSNCGGHIYGKNLVQRLAADDEIDLYVVNANAENHREGTASYFQNIGVEHLFVPLRPTNLAPESNTFGGRLSFLNKRLFRFPYEMEAHNQLHVAEACNRAIADWQIDYVLLDYLLATLFWKGIEKLPCPKAIITVHREADVYTQCIAAGTFPHGPLTGRISRWRLARFERRIYRSFDKVVAIGAPDVPPCIPASRTAVVTSYLDESPNQWTYQGNKTVFFVGNVCHYPNRLAVDHIVSHLAPRVLARVPQAKFAIIGALPAHVASQHHHPSIELMGTSTPAEVEHMFTNASLLLCPIANTFGMKFKIAEAAAYGTPFLASKQTMLGFPYLRGLPRLTLSNPDRSADAIVELLLHEDRLKSLSSEIRKRQQMFAASQKNIWSRTLFN